jgi:hypothetical protein
MKQKQLLTPVGQQVLEVDKSRWSVLHAPNGLTTLIARPVAGAPLVPVRSAPVFKASASFPLQAAVTSVAVTCTIPDPTPLQEVSSPLHDKATANKRPAIASSLTTGPAKKQRSTKYKAEDGWIMLLNQTILDQIASDALIAAELQKTEESAITQQIHDQVVTDAAIAAELEQDVWCTDRKGSAVTRKKTVPRKLVNKKVNAKSSVRATCPKVRAVANQAPKTTSASTIIPSLCAESRFDYQIVNDTTSMDARSHGNLGAGTVAHLSAPAMARQSTANNSYDLQSQPAATKKRSASIAISRKDEYPSPQVVVITTSGVSNTTASSTVPIRRKSNLKAAPFQTQARTVASNSSHQVKKPSSSAICPEIISAGTGTDMVSFAHERKNKIVLDSALAAHRLNLARSTTPKATVNNSHQVYKKPPARAGDPIVSAARRNKPTASTSFLSGQRLQDTLAKDAVAVHLRNQARSKASKKKGESLSNPITAYTIPVGRVIKRAKIPAGVNRLVSKSTAADFMEISSVFEEETDRLTKKRRL